MRQKTFMISGFFVCIILIFWVFIYSPKRKEMDELRLKYAGVQKEIDDIKRITGSEDNLDVIITKYAERLRQYESRLPVGEESVIRELAGEADRIGIKVVSINPEIPIDTNLPVSIQGCQCKELKLSVELVGSYRRLGEYIGFLQEGLSSVARIDNMIIRKLGRQEGGSILSASLDITLFIVVPKS